MKDPDEDTGEQEPTLDFFKFMDDTIQREEAKKRTVLPQPTDPGEPYNPNKEYLKRYSHRIADRMWIGPRRYQ